MSPADPSQIPVGTILEGKFRITQEVGRGGMAVVYEAENIDIGKQVAVKVLSAELITSRIVRERFIREARAAAAIHSPFICQVFDSGMFHERPFLVMELLRGESLYDRMTRLRRLKISTTLKIIRQVARGLGKAHQAGVVHRDLKPENIVLTRDDDGALVAKVVDFGLAKFYESRDNEPEKNIRLTREGALFGTPAYMSPEQVKGQGEVDHRADLWALACIVYECLTGRTVWDVQQGMAMVLAQIAKGELPNPLKWRADLPPSFAKWFEMALHPQLSQRFQTTQSFINSLDLALDVDLISISSAEAARALITEPKSQNTNELKRSNRPFSEHEVKVVNLAIASPYPRKLTWILGVSALLFGLYGYLSFSNALPEQSFYRKKISALAPAVKDFEPIEKGPGAEWIHRGQEALRKEELDDALNAFSNALGEAPHVAQSLIAHAKAGQEVTGNCALAGLGRPRPFKLNGEASHPRIVRGVAGILAIWTDAHQDSAKRNVYSARLDNSLRRVSPVRNLTPEATLAIQPRFAPIAGGFASVSWDSSSANAGVFIRSIDDSGRISSPPHRLSVENRAQYFPALKTLADGSLLVVWSDKQRSSAQNLVGQRLNSDLSATGPSFYLTNLKTGSALEPALDIIDDKIYLAYREVNRTGTSTIRLLRLSAELLGFHEKNKRVEAQKTLAMNASMNIALRTAHMQAAPKLSCNKAACMVVWDNEKAGSFIAYVRHQDEQALWHNEFSHSAKRPTVQRSDDGNWAIAYYDEDRLKMLIADAEGLSSPSVITKVSGYQPSPHLLAENQSGSWLLAWRDFEAGHKEIFVARAQCSGKKDP